MLKEVVLTENGSPRAMSVDDLAAIAREVFGADRIVVEPRLADAIETAVGLAEDSAENAGQPGERPVGVGVVVTGSVVTAGAARSLFGKEPA